MGIFDIFSDSPKTKKQTLENLSCIYINEWNDGYTATGPQIIDFIKEKLETMPYAKFISFLKKKRKLFKNY